MARFKIIPNLFLESSNNQSFQKQNYIVEFEEKEWKNRRESRILEER